ncbi:serine/threonine-protein kinase Nek2-like [Hippocampus zosterae]|uniref:serine/threonine-protein kinase Nek2-like n=1 Tax=Hippocampus zosterae TaxID=109293 RepID=UPI00223CA611|nr:serine/threonine-protein kinase Nek2-like [Hippocampus zosterae]
MLSYELAEYRFTKEIGRGNFSRVYRVQRIADGEHYALKRSTLPKKNQKKAAEYLLNEIRVQLSFDSPFIVKMYDCFFDSISNSIITVSELMTGGDLSHFVESHQHCQDQQHVKITDLNTAFINKSHHKEGQSMASTKAGTPLYLSPEIFMGEKYDSKTDIWSLGVLLYEMCNFHMPFSGFTLEQVSAKVINGRDLRPTASQLLARPYMKMKTKGDSSKPNVSGDNKENQMLIKTIRMPTALLKESFSTARLKEVEATNSRLQGEQDELRRTVLRQAEKIMYLTGCVRYQLYSMSEEQKDALISQLKEELMTLRQGEKEQDDLSYELKALEKKFEAALDEKNRAEREMRRELENENRSIMKVKREIEDLKSDINHINSNLSEINADNQSLKEMSEFRTREIEKLKNVAAAKEEKAKLDEAIAELKKKMEESSAKAKSLEKEIREAELENAKLEKNLMYCQKEYEMLAKECKKKAELIKQSEERQADHERKIKELEEEKKALEAKCKESKEAAEACEQKYKDEIDRGKALADKIQSLEGSIRGKEAQIEELKNSIEVNKQRVAILGQEAKALESEIEKNLDITAELESLHKDA